ncbi:hypothetical protein [Zavarzinella formosa]|uniref:hypothetical protein n=1 Tax=Zavarzinella formosa TaxID=360055 RepID=UPI0002F14996|nr:hypothetical protein [Zavarzinella formosa]
MRMRRLAKRAVIFIALVAVLRVVGGVIYDHRYPHGWSHCCDKQLYMALLNYADQHDGWFPKGEATPEASLSLLHRNSPEEVSANLLRGKTVPVEVVQARLDAGDLLTPETCGWHYVEGLRPGDDSRLALFWDKAGLGHNGERQYGGRHWVTLLDGSISCIPGEKWEEFLAEQDRLKSELKRQP